MGDFTNVTRKNLVYVLECAGVDPVLVEQVRAMSAKIGQLNKMVDRNMKLIDRLSKDNMALRKGQTT